MKRISRTKLGAFFLCAASALSASAQQTYNEMEQLTVNENVTTVITASEPIRLVDISTDKVVGDKPIENVIRVKPKEGGHEDGAVLAIVTVVTERYRSQYALIYTTRLEEAVSDKEVQMDERNAFHNPAVSMSTQDMVRYARRIWNSPAKYHSTRTNKHHATMRLNNVYAVGEYFFIDFSVENKTDFSVENKTNLRFDIDELRFKLCDKKQQKATNVQDLMLEPTLLLDRSMSFQRGYRNVAVLKKMTFPNDKVLTIELSEKQISGRTISMTIDYEDILSADAFDSSLLIED